jgi:hypothetical protein
MPWIRSAEGGNVTDFLRRRGPRPYVAPTLAWFRSSADGPPVRLRDLAAVTGLSKPKLQADARAGHLRLLPTTGRLLLVDYREARRYLRELGLIVRD